MKQNKAWNWILAIVFGIQLLAESAALWQIIRLNMLPGKYLGILVVIFVLLALISGILMFLHRKGKTVGTVRRILALILSVVILVGCLALSYVLTDLYRTMDKITTPSSGDMTRSVYVQMSDTAWELKDTIGYTFGVVAGYDTESTEQALEYIKQEINTALKVQSFATVPEMVDALLTGQIGCMILNDAYLPILTEDAAYADIDQRIRSLKDVPVSGILPAQTVPRLPEATTEPPVTEAPTTEPPVVEPDVTNTPFVIYISGSDTRYQSLPTKTRSDVNILAVVNPVTKQVLLLNTPRDYYVQHPTGGSPDKLTHLGIYGTNCSVAGLENLYDLEVKAYVKINFTGFETFIDAIGGVTVYSDVGFTAWDTWIGPGENHLNGVQALNFCRERYHLAGGDNARGKNQMKVIKAVIEKLTSGPTIISRYSQILDSLEGMFMTDFPMEDLSLLVKMQLDDMASWDIHSYAVTGSTGRAVTYSMPGQKLSVMFVNEKLVDHGSRLAHRVLSGDILTEEDLQVP